MSMNDSSENNAARRLLSDQELEEAIASSDFGGSLLAHIDALAAQRDELAEQFQNAIDSVHAQTVQRDDLRALPSRERHRTSLAVDRAIASEVAKRGPNRSLVDDAYIAGMRAAFRVVQTS